MHGTTGDTRFLVRIVRGLTRSRREPIGSTVRKGASLMLEGAAARIYLRNCTSVGPGARTVDRPIIVNQGRIVIGGGFVMRSHFSPAELTTGPEGTIEIGEAVWVNFGSVIRARSRIHIGDRSQIAPYSILCDTEAPEREDLPYDEPRPIHIGRDVWIAGRVTVLPGTTIGDGSVITAGSVVSGEIPAGVVAGGNPARVLRHLDGTQPEPADHAPKRVVVRPATAHAAVSKEPSFRGVLLADFTATTLKNAIEMDGEAPSLAVEEAPFGQVVQSLLHGEASDFAFVWTRPEATINAFRKLLACESVSPEELSAEVDSFCAMLLAGAERFKFVFVATWTLPAWQRGKGAFDVRAGGASPALWAMNLRMSENLARAPNVYVLDAQHWIDATGRGFMPRAWFLGKVAFHDEVLAAATRDLKAALRGLHGGARKLLVLDLDDTLWGGIVGDVGWENLRLGGHDADGEAYVELQRAAKALTRRGIILALVSKNEETTALEAIRQHPEMVLREEDFVGWRINWNDKAQNIAELTAELNLGLQSVVFIDDNPVERARVREALPEVLVPDWPEDKLLCPSALLALRCFDSPNVTREDAERTQLYGAERKRDALLAQVGSLDDWLKSLELRVAVSRLSNANIARAAQLLNKTNQLNLSTRRLSESELLAWAQGPSRSLWTVTVSDRFGDAGLTGIVSIEADSSVGRVVDFVLSCRVMGRRVEETMLHLAVAEAQRMGLASVEARYAATAKNKPVLTFFQGSGWPSADGELFRWDARSQAFALPEAITLERVE